MRRDRSRRPNTPTSTLFGVTSGVRYLVPPSCRPDYLIDPSPKKQKARGYLAFRSGRRDLNPRRPPWQGGTLPLSYSRGISRAGCLDEEAPGVNNEVKKVETFRRVGRGDRPTA